MSDEAMQSKMMGHQGIPPIRILPPQVARLKKEEEEKTWISDEDLYTEGSSDEENCRCNKEKSSAISSNQSSLASSTTTTITTATTALDNPHQLRPKPKRSKSSRSSDSLLAVQSTSRCSRESSRSSIASDEETEVMEEEEDIADEEISWKVNRETLIMEDEALQDYQQEYPEVCNSMHNIFEDYFNTLKTRENMCNENFKRQKEKLQGEINNAVQFFDAVIGKLHSEIECIKQKTRQVQLQNRMRLIEIIKQGPRESKTLAQNTKNFFDLVDDEQLKDLSDVTSCTTFNTYENSDSQYSQVKRKLMELLNATDTTRKSFSGANSTKSIIKS